MRSAGLSSVQAHIDAAYRLSEQRQFAEAEASCRRALVLSDSRHPGAWTALGVVLRDSGRVKESESAYRAALRVAPNYIAAHHNLGALLSYLERPEEALMMLDRAVALGLQAPELYINRGRTLAQLYRLDEAENAYRRAVSLDATNTTAQVNLAQLRYMRGDPQFARDFESVIRIRPADATLQYTYAELLQRAGKLADAEAVLRSMIKRSGPSPEARSVLASILHEMGRLKEAETEALEGAIGRPSNASGVATLVALELALGHPEVALPFVKAQLKRSPHEQRWIAFAALTARMLGDPLYGELYNYRYFVRSYDLEPPPGWKSIEELNSALIDALTARHRFATHPLDQSLRNGSQTARSLLTDDNDAIRALLAAFVAPIEDYRMTIGTRPDHPLTARNRGNVRLSGCWSVELRRDGFHVNHIHPEGWISSAYYVAVPDETADASIRSGWLKFGEPRLPIPGVTAEHFVQPRAGRLVLFPSYMTHGTNAITGDQARLTVAFDAVPSN